MKYYKIVMDGYILGIYVGKDGVCEITKEEYDTIQATLNNAPETPDGFGCRLREDLVWELFELAEDEMME